MEIYWQSVDEQVLSDDLGVTSKLLRMRLMKIV